MPLKSTTTYTLSDADVKQAIAEFVGKRKSLRPEALKVKIDIDPGSPYHNQLDAGRPATLKVTVETED